MSYEIPQELQYKERIVFGLTMQQLVYAALAAFPILLIMRTSLDIWLRVVVSLCIATVGLLCIYADLPRKVVQYVRYLRDKSLTRWDAKAIKWLGINGIQENCFILDKGKVAVLRIDPLNFKIKPPEEKHAIISTFQKMLNALDFPVQFLICTDELDLSKYLETLASRATADHKDLYESHKASLVQLMHDRNTHNRQFYLVIPERDKQLDAQLAIIDGLLRTLNLKYVRLTTNELTALIARLLTPIRPKDASLQERIAPRILHSKPSLIQTDSKLHRILYAAGYPRSVDEGWLDRLITSPGNFNISIHVNPFPISDTLVMLNREIQKQKADLYAAQLKTQFIPSLDIQYQDTKAVLDNIQRGEDKLFTISLYVDIKADDEKELERQTRQAVAHLNSVLIIPHTPRYRMLDALKGTLPLAHDALAKTRYITTRALSSFFPFTSPFLILENDGVFLGLNKNKLPVIKDVFALSNANGAILATSGSGKSFTAKLLLSRYLMNGASVVVIDPQGEYVKLTEKHKGTVITIKQDSKTILNPLDLMGHSYIEKRLQLIDIFRIMLGDLSENQKAVLDRAVSEAYLNAGISEHLEKDKVPPVIGDIYKEIEKLGRSATGVDKYTYVALQNRLSMYVTGVFSFLNRQSDKPDLTSPFVTFDISQIPKPLKPLMMYLILDFVYMRMKQDRQRKLLVIDEAWSLLSRTEEESYVFEIVKTCRKYNMGLLMITQDVADLLQSKAGRAVLANSSYTILLRQKPSVINSIQEVFHLSHAERDHLLTAQVGDGLLMMDNDHHEIRIIASQTEHNLITTKPEELDKIIPPDATHAVRKMLIEMDLSKGVYRKSKLGPEQVEYLRKHNYIEESIVPLRGVHPSLFLVKNLRHHTPEHTYVLHATYEELLEYTKNVRIDEDSRQSSVNPDIIFTNAQNKEIALEVETGNNWRYNNDYLKKKVRLLQERFGDNWRIILTDTNYRRKYETAFGNIILVRRQVPAFIKSHFSRLSLDNTRGSRSARNTDEKGEAADHPPKNADHLRAEPKRGVQNKKTGGAHDHRNTRTRTKDTKKVPRVRRLPARKR